MQSRSATGHAFLGGLVALILTGGCRSEKPPPGPVGRADVIGAWRYADVADDDADRWVVTIQFADDGTFRQTLVPPHARNPIGQTGIWRLEGGAVKVGPLIVWDESTAGHWTQREQAWPVRLSAKRPGTLALCGGLAADHSLDREMDRISDAECRLLTSLAPAAGR